MTKGIVVKFGDKCEECGVEITSVNCSYHQWRIRNKCHTCYREQYNAWQRKRREDPEVLQKHKAGMKRVHLQRTYQITEEEYNKLSALQQNVCAICKQSCGTHESLSVDHDHLTGEVRGLLCQKCNTAIAMLNENEDLFWNAMEYLKKYKWSKTA